MADFSSLVINDVVISPKGAKYAAITTNGTRPSYAHGEFVRAPFGPSNFDKDESAPRQTLEFRTDATMRQFFESLDAWAKSYILQHSESLFKKKLTAEQIEERYVSVLKQHPAHDALLKTKINMANSATPCRIWNEAGERVQLPTYWRHVECKPRIQISNLWIMSAQFGLVLQITDLLVREERHEFPWAEEMGDAF